MNDLLKKLQNKNITINVIDNQLDIKAPKGAMTKELLSEIKKHKEALMSFMSKYKSEEATNVVIPRASNKSNYILSSSQYRLWLLQQIENDNSTYNMPSLFSLKGSINSQNLEKAFLKLITRHEILRTNIIVEKETGVPKQIITSVEANNFKLDYVDISKDKDVSETLQTIIEKEVNYNFDLESDTLIRVSLIKKSNDDYILISVMHHIISDGWSSSIMITDLFSIYQSILKGEDIQIEPLSIQYKDFAEWQQATLDSDFTIKDKNYWLHQFKEEVPILEIPTYKLRPSIKTYNGKTIEKRLDKDVIQGFKEVCNDQGATLFMGLLSAVKLLFYKYTNQSDIVIGSPFAGRELTELQNQIGFYVNTVGLRSSFKKEDTFKTLLNQVKNTTLKAYDHQNYPFDELIKNLELTTDRSRNPLFDVVLTVDAYEEILDKIDLIQDLTIEEISLDDTTSKFDLEFAFREDKKGSNLFLTYNTDIYTEDFVTQITDHLEVLLKNIIESPELTIESLPYLTAKEKKQLLEEFNNTKTDFKCVDKNYIDVFEDQVEKTPNNIAVVFEEKKLTYKELDELTNQLAHYLIDNHDVSLEDFIGVKLERSDWLIISFLAILKTGGAYLPIDIEYPKERIAFIESDSNCKVIIDHSIISEFKKNKNQLKTLPLVKINDTNLAYVIYTSGSTGTPKGTLIEHKNLLNLCFWHINKYEVDESSKGTLYSGIAFDASIWEMTPYLLAGATLYPISEQAIRLDLNKLTSFLKDNSITHAYLPTSITHELVNDNFKSKDITILTGGDTLKINKVPSFKLYNNYGPTENTVVTTFFNLQHGFDSSIPIGKPISNTSCYILDDNLEPLPIGISGKLYISGAGVARGYLNNPDLTEECFIANPFIEGERMYDTGDLVKWLPDGNIEFLGRKDSQVKIRGYRIELEEIENTIVQFSEAIQQVILDVKGTEQEKELVAYYISKSEINKSELRDFLQERLPSYMVPSYYMVIDTIPLTPNGKIDKKSLPKITSEALIHKKYVAPRNKTEQGLVNIWQEVLGLEKIGIIDNFFELGGHSLFAIKIINKIAIVFKKPVSITELFTKNIKEISILLENMGINSEIEIEVAEVLESYPLTPMQYAMWVSCQFGGVQAYNMPMAIEVNGILQIDKFEKAFNAIVQKYDVLRSEFVIDDDLEPRQVFKDESEFTYDFEFVVLEDIDKDTYLNGIYSNKFDLSKSPLFRVGIIEIDSQKNIFYLNLHHLIGDGWSMELIYRDVIANYYELIINGEVNQDKPEIQYKDFSSWVANNKNSELFLSNKSFWKNVFITPHTVIKLPFQNENSKNTAGRINFSGSAVLDELSPELSRKIDSFCKKSHISPFNFFLSSLKILIYHYTNTNDVIIGTPVHGRLTRKLENQLGLFINTIPVRTFIDPEVRFNDFLAKQHTDLAKYLDHQIFMPNEMFNELKIDASSSKSPFFDIVFVLQNQASLKMSKLSLLENIELELKPTSGESGFAQFGLAFAVSRDIKNMFYEIGTNFNTTLYEKESIEDFLINYKLLMKELLENETSVIEVLKTSVNIPQQNEGVKIKSVDEAEGEVVTNENVLSIINIFQKILNTEGVVRYKDDFFIKGGTSLKAIKLIIEVNKLYKTKITIVDFINNSTVEGIHKLVFKEETTNVNVTKEKMFIIFNPPKKDLEDLFFIPPIIGMSLIFHKLANALKNKFNCYGFNIPLIEKTEQFIPYIVEAYVNQIKELKKQNKVTLLGYSIGATIGFELAKRLEAEGLEISLILFDREPSIKEDIYINDTYVNGIIESHSVFLQDVKNIMDDDVDIIIKQVLMGFKNHITSGKIKGDIIAFEAIENTVNARMRLWESHTDGVFRKIYLSGDHFDVLNEENLESIIKNI